MSVQTETRRGFTLEQLRDRGHRLTEEALRESEAAGIIVERGGVWYWTDEAERAFGEAFRRLPEAPS